jgi:hypothetical protein
MQGLQILWRSDIELELQSVKKWNLKVDNSTIGKFYKIIIFIHRIQNFIDLSHHSRFSRKRGTYFIRLYVEKMQNILKN